MNRQRSVLAAALVAGGIIMGTSGFLLMSSGAPYPVGITLVLAPQTGCSGGTCSPGQAPDNLPTNSLIATATVTMSSGPNCTDFVNVCPLTIVPSAIFQVSTSNPNTIVVAPPGLNSSEDGSQTATVSTI